MGKKKSVDETEGVATVVAEAKPNIVDYPTDVEGVIGGVARVVVNGGADASAKGPFVPDDVTVGDTLAVANLTSGTHEIPLALIAFGKNPRELFDDAMMQELADSMKLLGQIHPIGVYRMDEPDADGKLFVVEAGERRCRAAALAGFKTVRAEIKVRAGDELAYVRRIIENTQRADLTPMEKAKAYYEVYRYYDKDTKKACVALGLRRADDTGDEGTRVFTQTMQFATHLIPVVMDALQKGPRDGGIPPAHAALLCRVDQKYQAEMLKACFEPRQVFNGADHEPIPTLISEKELRGKLAARFPKEENRQAQMFDSGAVNGVAKDKNDLDREHQQKLEEQADGMLAGAADSEVQDAAPKLCDICGEVPSIGVGNGGKHYCDRCHRAAVADLAERVLPSSEPTEAPKAKDDDTQDPPESNDYEKLKKERVERVSFAIGRLDDDVSVLSNWAARVARMLAGPMIDAELFATIYGAPIVHQKGNRISWPVLSLMGGASGDMLSGTVGEYIDYLERVSLNRHAVKHLRKVIVVLMVLPTAQNPSYPDDAVKALEEFYAAPKTEPSKPKAAKKPASKPAAKKSDKISGAQIAKNVAAAKKSKQLKPTPKKKSKK